MANSGPESRSGNHPQIMRLMPLMILIVLALGLLACCVVIFPRYLAASDMNYARVPPTELAQARNNVRTTLLQGFGGMVLLIGAYLTWRQTQISRAGSQEELRLSREGQLTDKFTRAIEQLGSDDVAVRVGAIYALGRVADESMTDRAAIADILTVYVHKHAPWPPDPRGPFPEEFPIDQLPHLAVRAPDIQAILTVLGRRTPSPPLPATWTSLNLNRTDLRRGSLTGANLQRAAFRGASLAKAWLFKADLRGADLRDADLRGATLSEAIADLTTWWPSKKYNPEAEGVHVYPSLEYADLRCAFLKRDDLTGISLRGARANAFTVWPDGFDWRQAGVIMDDVILGTGGRS